MTKQTTYILQEGPTTLTAVETDGTMTGALINTGDGNKVFSLEKAQQILHGYTKKDGMHVDGVLNSTEPGAPDHIGTFDLPTLTKMVVEMPKGAQMQDDARVKAEHSKACKTTYYDVPNGGESFLPMPSPTQKTSSKGPSK